MQKSVTKNRIVKLIIISLIVSFALVFFGNTLAAITKRLNISSKSSGYISSNGVMVNNSTYSFPIEYVLGDVRREITVETDVTSEQLVRVKVGMYYVDLGIGSAAYDYSSKLALSTVNVNIINKFGQNWYFDANTGYAYCFNTFGSGSKREVLLNGVEFFEIPNAGLYNKKGLVIKTTVESLAKDPSASPLTALNTWGNAPAAWLNKMNNNESIVGHDKNSVSIYNLRNIDNKIIYGVDTHRAPIYVQNQNNYPCDLRLNLTIYWSNQNLFINNVKFNFNSIGNYHSLGIVSSPITKGEQNNLAVSGSASYEFFYDLRLEALQQINVLESIEIINNNYNMAEYPGASLSLAVIAEVLPHGSYNTLDEFVSQGWTHATQDWVDTINVATEIHNTLPYNAYSYAVNKPILFDKIINAGNTKTITSPSTFVNNSSTQTYKVNVKYDFEWMVWNEYMDVLQGKYIYWKATEPYVTVNPNQWSGSNNQYSTTYVEPGKSIDLYSTINIEAPSLTALAPKTVDELVSMAGETYGYDSNGNKDQSIDFVKNILEYIPKQYLIMTMTITVETATAGVPTTLYNGEVFNSTSIDNSFNLNIGTYYYSVGVKNTSNGYKTLKASIAQTGGRVNLITSWTENGGVYTKENVAPGEVVELISGFTVDNNNTQNIHFSVSLTLENTTAVASKLKIKNSTLEGGATYRIGSNALDVSVTNNDSANKYLRIKVKDVWLLPSNITTPPSVTRALINSSDWQVGSDGYIYYIGKFVTGQTLALYDDFNITSSDQGDYKLARYKMDVVCEVSDNYFANADASWLSRMAALEKVLDTIN